jgi:hypothetical protein
MMITARDHLGSANASTELAVDWNAPCSCAVIAIDPGTGLCRAAPLTGWGTRALQSSMGRVHTCQLSARLACCQQPQVCWVPGIHQGPAASAARSPHRALVSRLLVTRPRPGRGRMHKTRELLQDVRGDRAQSAPRTETKGSARLEG